MDCTPCNLRKRVEEQADEIKKLKQENQLLSERRKIEAWEHQVLVVTQRELVEAKNEIKCHTHENELLFEKNCADILLNKS